ncbi:PH domain-containing protein [Alkalihalobacterium bogoriense]|uniref:PH domain-containing protein n=1 Tax=Alkalihalobacterium bogoriense TaxID=246272 RepID=UPI00047D445C|nr:PH domain-containing protein [Alkalihalobacterium bogoriense]
MIEMKRLHPIMILVSFLTSIRQLILPIGVSFFVGGFNRNVIFIVVSLSIALLFAFVSGLLHWITFRYSLHEGELTIKQGFFVKKTRYIRQERVQSIDVSAGVIQRLFKLVKVKIETAGGGGEPELLLQAVTKEEAMLLRSQLLQGKKAKEVVVEESVLAEDVDHHIGQEEVRWKISLQALLVVGMTSGGFGLVFSALLAIFPQVSQFLPDRIYDIIFSFFTETALFNIIIIFIFLFLLSWTISVLMTVLKYANFTIKKLGDDLVIERGLLETRQLTLNPQRVTAVRLVNSLLRQPFGLTTIYVESKGGGTSDEQFSTILCPLIRMKDVPAFLDDVLPDYALHSTLTKAPKRALLRFIIRVTLVPLVIMGILAYFVPFGAYSFCLLPFLLVLAYVQYKDTGVSYEGQSLCFRFRKLSQTTVLLKRNRIESVETHQSVIQRFRKLTSLEASVLSSIVGKSFSVIDLDEEEKSKFLQWYSYEKKEEV